MNSSRFAWPAFCRAAVVALVTGVVFTSSGCAWLDTKGRQLTYRPTPGVPADFPGLKPGDSATTVLVTSHEPTPRLGGGQIPAGTPQALRLWWLPHADPAAPSLIYLHGTFRNLYQNLNKIDALRAAGFSVFAVDYRGWGSSEAIVPSEASIKADSKRAWEAFVAREPNPRRRVIYGHSMGGGVAVALAAQLTYPRDFSALILESTFPSMPAVAASAGFLGRIGAAITTERFDSLALMPSIDAPLLMLHGDADNTVPFALGQRLFGAARMPDKTFVAFPGGRHSSLQDDGRDRYQQALRELIARLPP